MQPEIIAPYSVNQFLENLDIYKTCQGTDEMLDLVRLIQSSGNYQWRGVSFPDPALQSIPAQVTVSGSIQLPPGTYITAINAYFNPVTNPEGFRLKIFDKGSKASIFYGEWAQDRIICSNLSLQYGVGTTNPPSDPGMNPDDPFGPGYLLNPFIITEPGVLGWEIVNESVATNLVQVLVNCAIPVSGLTIGTKQVRKV